MFTNRHVIIALLVCPLLAVMTWFAVGEMVAEDAAPARPGQSYPLVARSNCRYASGQCDLENGSLTLSLSYADSHGSALELQASHSLDSVLLAVAAGGESTPRAMQSADRAGRLWRLPLSQRPAPGDRLQIVAAAAGSRYFAESAAAFLAGED
jgi:hypothetical protein